MDFLKRHPLIHRAVDYVLELVQIVVISLAIIIPIRYFLIQPFYVRGASMEPAFIDHEYLIIDELSYRFKDPVRGEIVVFKYPGDPRQYFIKRIVGLPGEKIQFTGGKVIVYNDEYNKGLVLIEPYIERSIFTSGDKTVQLEADQYFVLGDNRNSSLDSRFFGPLERRMIVGRVWLRGWPLDRLSIFDKPVYNE